MFNTQFVEVLPKEKITRNLSVLQQFGIEDRILREINDFSYIDKMIDFNAVNEKVNVEREKSLVLSRKCYLNLINGSGTMIEVNIVGQLAIKCLNMLVLDSCKKSMVEKLY